MISNMRWYKQQLVNIYIYVNDNVTHTHKHCSRNCCTHTSWDKEESLATRGGRGGGIKMKISIENYAKLPIWNGLLLLLLSTANRFNIEGRNLKIWSLEKSTETFLLFFRFFSLFGFLLLCVVVHFCRADLKVFFPCNLWKVLNYGIGWSLSAAYCMFVIDIWRTPSQMDIPHIHQADNGSCRWKSNWV